MSAALRRRARGLAGAREARCPAACCSAGARDSSLCVVGPCAMLALSDAAMLSIVRLCRGRAVGAIRCAIGASRTPAARLVAWGGYRHPGGMRGHCSHLVDPSRSVRECVRARSP